MSPGDDTPTSSRRRDPNATPSPRQRVDNLVLIVEDDTDFRAALSVILLDHDFEVMEARDGEEGLERLRDVLPAIILCDVRMPVVSGHEFLTRLRLDADAALIPVIFLTAAAEARDVRQGMNLGADDYLTKPVSVDDLLGSIHARLQRRSALQASQRAAPAPTVPIRSRDDIIAGRYRLLVSAARGGMGSIYRARDLAEARDVAVKIVSRQDVVPGRFERECTILAGLTHERVVRYHAHGATEAGERYLVMDWLPGHDLARELETRTLSVAEVLTVLRGAAEALAVAHAAGVVHRDVKPANLFLVDGALARVTLIDFGIARACRAGGPTPTGELMGTPGYVAPELLERDRHADPRCDVFGLGCTAWACLAGAPPFSATSPIVALGRALFLDPGPVRALCPEVPEALDRLLAAMLERDPERRLADGRAVLDALAAMG